jgi:hypothetical protein
VRGVEPQLGRAPAEGQPGLAHLVVEGVFLEALLVAVLDGPDLTLEE